MIKQVAHPSKLAPLFADWPEMMIRACLQGVMGKMYANEAQTAAMILLGDFAFYAGVPDASLAAFVPQDVCWSGKLLIPHDAAWDGLLGQVWRDRAEHRTRFAVRKEPVSVFDRDRLRRLAAVPSGMTLHAIDEELYQRCLSEEWTRDFVANYPDAASFLREGLGVVLMRGDEILAGASSYASYREGIEIEIDTRSDVRRQGLATVCAANLILRCLELGLYPSWDAQNKMSLGLAEKLGYHAGTPYPVWEVFRPL